MPTYVCFLSNISIALESARLLVGRTLHRCGINRNNLNLGFSATTRLHTNGEEAEVDVLGSNRARHYLIGGLVDRVDVERVTTIVRRKVQQVCIVTSFNPADVASTVLSPPQCVHRGIGFINQLLDVCSTDGIWNLTGQQKCTCIDKEVIFWLRRLY